MTQHEIEKTEIQFETADRFQLHVTLMRGKGDGPMALISSAAAGPRGFYARFAEHLVTHHGFRAAMTYDYRGIGGSAAPRGATRSTPFSTSSWP